jgi:dienelactone hydrolase
MSGEAARRTIGGRVSDMRGRRARVGLFLALLGAAFLGLAAGPFVRWARAVEFLSALGSAPPDASTGARIVEEEVRILGRSGQIRARLYFRADRPKARAIVVAHGVHHEGIDERRLVPFARALARTGRVVLTPELEDLADYRITASGVEVIGDAVAYALGRPDRVEGSSVGLLGFSFAGGLALVAAEDPALGRRLDFVTSVGGHHDLSRVLRFLVRSRIETPSGVRAVTAHEYGLVVLVYGHLERFVPAHELDVMRPAVKAWLKEDRPHARRLAAPRRSPESERLWQLLEKGRVQTLAPEVDAVLAEKTAELRALSPSGRLDAVRVPVYLLHGTHDSVIPPSEVEWAARELRSHPHATLVTPLLEHVSVAGNASWDEKLALVRFISRIM